MLPFSLRPIEVAVHLAFPEVPCMRILPFSLTQVSVLVHQAQPPQHSAVQVSV